VCVCMNVAFYLISFIVCSITEVILQAIKKLCFTIYKKYFRFNFYFLFLFYI